MIAEKHLTIAAIWRPVTYGRWNRWHFAWQVWTAGSARVPDVRLCWKHHGENRRNTGYTWTFNACFIRQLFFSWVWLSEDFLRHVTLLLIPMYILNARKSWTFPRAIPCYSRCLLWFFDEALGHEWRARGYLGCINIAVHCSYMIAVMSGNMFHSSDRGSHMIAELIFQR